MMSQQDMITNRADDLGTGQQLLKLQSLRVSPLFKSTPKIEIPLVI